MVKEKSAEQGVYTFREAASLLGVPYHRVYRWFRGVVGRHKPVFKSERRTGAQLTVTFYELIEARVALALIGKGHPLSRVRRVYRELEKSVGLQPFCRSTLKANEFEILAEELTAAGDKSLVDPINRQRLSRLLDPLLEDVTPDETGRFVEWQPKNRPGVVISPKYSFGTPVTILHRIPTYVLFEAWQANGEDAESVAQWYGVKTEEVQNAVSFESHLRKAA